MIGIYKIENLINHKVYIGQSIDVERRIKQHKYIMMNPSKHYPLKDDILKYGYKSFTFEVLEICNTQKESFEREIFWNKFYGWPDPNKVYTKAEGGPTNKGYKQTEEAKQKIGEAKKGEKNFWHGKKRIKSEEEKLKISLALKGRHYVCSEKRLIHLRTVNLGRKRSSEYITMIKERNRRLAKYFSEQNKGRVFITNGTDDKMIRKEDLSTYIEKGWYRGRCHLQDYSKRRKKNGS